MAEQQAISELLHAYGAALDKGNVDETVALYTDDGVFMAPGYQPMVGTEALRKSYERVFASTRLDIEFDLLEIVITSAEWAFARSTATGTKLFIQRGDSEPHANQELFILRKVDGSWKIARYAFSSMKPIV
ncbi:hypothetical protein A1O1_07576 [Capronia coronata CBS 617.96]|uniref:SnoaL-like domain-containing protein n=1 Tax=Capronia coronata CBS 617.96 TaxID=1182541 RepID=W9XLW1_9EURO|nr:uncharacterized protein A1O1_07576 [Capronia coronata CBS 617.96]EXJ81512.1 hypothetical protein A1O1_07576 [Capronia coronata CBS 617.96]